EFLVKSRRCSNTTSGQRGLFRLCRELECSLLLREQLPWPGVSLLAEGRPQEEAVVPDGFGAA
ncbi:MAG: hypothetical protein MI741_05585, partial [Rhodospirillales bacterium]|nr:hypothetical protein [Rhodospirillales bacterium]